MHTMIKRYLQWASAGSKTVALVPVTTVLVLAIALASNAYGGTYVINNCPSAPTTNGNPGPWTVFGAPQNTKGSCSGGPGSYIGPSGGFMDPATIAGVQVNVPAASDITIREAKVWWQVPHQLSGADTFALASDNSGVVGEGQTPLERWANPDNFVLASTTTTFVLADYCTNDNNAQGCTFGTGENSILALYGAQLTLFDSGLPSGSVTGGALAGGGTVAGTVALAYSAQDGDSGVRQVQVLLDGQLVATHDYLSECPYQNFAACPSSVSGTISWNTIGTSNGTHEVALRVINAAGNPTVIGDHTITIDNPLTAGLSGASIGPGSPAIIRGAPNGTNASDQAKLTARWAAGTSKEARTSGYGTADRVTGRLVGTGGQPISGAQLDVYETPRYEGAKTVPLARTSTGPRGSWTLTLPTGISSSTLRFEYRSHQNDTIPVATATLRLEVHAGIALRIAPHTSSVGGTIFFSGTLHGAPIPPGGKQLVLEASSGGEWIEFRTIDTDAKGRYRARYRFKLPGPVTYRFRVLSREEADFPFLEGASNVVTVHER